jgi:hypothetical protein
MNRKPFLTTLITTAALVFTFSMPVTANAGHGNDNRHNGHHETKHYKSHHGGHHAKKHYKSHYGGNHYGNKRGHGHYKHDYSHYKRSHDHHDSRSYYPGYRSVLSFFYSS